MLESMTSNAWDTFQDEQRGTDQDEQATGRKPKLSRKNLNDHDIDFVDIIYPIDLDNQKRQILPDHVEPVRRTLLSFGTGPHYDHRDEYARRVEQFKAGLKRADEEDGGKWSHRAIAVESEFTLLPPADPHAWRWQGRLRSSPGAIYDHLKAAEDAADRMNRRQDEDEWTVYLRGNIFQDHTSIASRQRFTPYAYVDLDCLFL